MGGDADMSDLPGLFRIHKGFQCAAGGADLLQIRRGRVVNLVQVNIVGAEIFQADVNVLRHGLRRAGHTLCGKHKMLPDALQTDPQVFLADGIAPGSIDVVDAVFQQLVHKRFRPLRVNALDGNSPKAHAGDFQSGFSEDSVFHSHALLSVFDIIRQNRRKINLSNRKKRVSFR